MAPATFGASLVSLGSMMIPASAEYLRAVASAPGLPSSSPIHDANSNLPLSLTVSVTALAANNAAAIPPFISLVPLP